MLHQFVGFQSQLGLANATAGLISISVYLVCDKRTHPSVMHLLREILAMPRRLSVLRRLVQVLDDAIAFGNLLPTAQKSGTRRRKRPERNRIQLMQGQGSAYDIRLSACPALRD